MKIIAIGRNYALHAKEMKSEVPEEPVFFMKPETSLIRKNQPFYYPAFSNDIHHEVEIVLRISRPGKNIPAAFAHTYYDAIGIGIDFTARDLQNTLKSKGLPWEKAKAFDGAAPVSDRFIPKEDIAGLAAIAFRLDVNGKTVQSGSTADLIFSFDELIAYVSRFVTLKTGDLIFTGTPEGVGPVRKEDLLEAFIGEEKLLEVKVL